MVAEQARRRGELGRFGNTYGHWETTPKKDLHAKHRLLNLNWQLR